MKKWWGGHWQKTEETMTLVGWPLAEDRGDSEEVTGGSPAGERGVRDEGRQPGSGQWRPAKHRPAAIPRTSARLAGICSQSVVPKKHGKQNNF